MLQRVLVREKVDERRRGLFRASGITTHRQLLQRPLWDVAHAVDMSVRETEELLQKLSIRLAPASCSAFDLFLESANHPMFLRTGLPSIDRALNGGLHCRALSEFVGTAGIGKSQVAMTLAVVCAMDYPDNGIMFFDVEHNFSAKRLLQITVARIRLTRAGQEVDTTINEKAAAIIKRIRVVKVNSMAAFSAKFKEMEDAMHSLKAKLIIIDCVTTLFLKAGDFTHAQRQHQKLRLARDLKLFADTYQAFVVVTNRATTVEGDGGLYTKPLLGDSWAHCVTTRFIMERHSLYRAMTIVKSPAAGYIVQPFTVKEGGVVAVEEEDASHGVESEDFAIDDDLLSDLPIAGLPTVAPASTLRSTQQSNDDEDPDKTQLVKQSDDESQSKQHEEQDAAAETESSFDIVSDSNDEDDVDSFNWQVTEA